jgi:hypothetical protein
MSRKFVTVQCLNGIWTTTLPDGVRVHLPDEESAGWCAIKVAATAGCDVSWLSESGEVQLTLLLDNPRLNDNGGLENSN